MKSQLLALAAVAQLHGIAIPDSADQWRWFHPRRAPLALHRHYRIEIVAPSKAQRRRGIKRDVNKIDLGMEARLRWVQHANAVEAREIARQTTWILRKKKKGEHSGHGKRAAAKRPARRHSLARR